jgi:heme-degrading monooxygenase HmoA
MRDATGSGTHFTATGEATIMSKTAEGLALAEDAARLDAKAALHADRLVPKPENGELQGVRDLQACQHNDKFFVMVTWDSETARRAAEMSAAMHHAPKATIEAPGVQKPGAGRSVFDRLMH